MRRRALDLVEGGVVPESCLGACEHDEIERVYAATRVRDRRERDRRRT